jgi:hypothetical protein
LSAAALTAKDRADIARAAQFGVVNAIDASDDAGQEQVIAMLREMFPLQSDNVIQR